MGNYVQSAIVYFQYSFNASKWFSVSANVFDCTDKADVFIPLNIRKLKKKNDEPTAIAECVSSAADAYESALCTIWKHR